MLVEHGEHVDKGQVLAEVDSLELRSLQLELLEARARLRWTTESLSRLQGLASKQITAQKDVSQLETDVQRLQFRVHSLGQQLALLGLSADEITEIENIDLTHSDSADGLVRTLAIRAPAAGWIADFDIVPGQVVGPEEQLFEIHDLSTVWVKAFVFQPAEALLEAGQPARVTFLADPERTVVGSIVRTAPVATGREQVLPVWIEVDNPDQRLKEGMLARVMFAPIAVRAPARGSAQAAPAQTAA
jgi:cobalt-zinc-cadmium efflux system membrane fusion protein